MDSFSITVPKPCHEKFDSFQPSKKGGFCSSCQKEVIDFTTWDEDRLKAYFLQGGGACGRFRPQQLRTYTLAAEKGRRPHWLSVMLTAMVIIFSSRTTVAQGTMKSPVRVEQRVVEKETDTRATSPSSLFITGKVVSGEDGSPWPGVSVVRVGSTDGAVTNADGVYELTISKPAATETITFSFIGMITENITVQPGDSLRFVRDVSMRPDVTGWGEAVTLGGYCVTRWYSPRGLWWRVKSVPRRIGRLFGGY